MNKTITFSVIAATLISTYILLNFAGTITQWKSIKNSVLVSENKNLRSIEDSQTSIINSLKDKNDKLSLKEMELQSQIMQLETKLIEKDPHYSKYIKSDSKLSHSWSDSTVDRKIFNGQILKKVFDTTINKDRFIFLMKNGEVRVPEKIYFQYHVKDTFICTIENCQPVE